MKDTVVLNFDHSVGPLSGADTIRLSKWQEVIRYGCKLRDLDRLERALDLKGFASPRITFMGSGDFHHLSYLLIRRLASKGPFQVAVFDNHPDNMRYPWGIHCGSWVHHVCKLPFVSKVTVIGITSDDIRWTHLWENHLLPLYTGKLSYVSLAPLSSLISLLRLRRIERFEGKEGALPEWIADRIAKNRLPVYLSIDKDVLSTKVVQTNWDQGILTEETLLESVRRFKSGVFAADITGEISHHRYQKLWKRALSKWDGQSDLPPPDLERSQANHRLLNEKIISLLRPL